MGKLTKCRQNISSPTNEYADRNGYRRNSSRISSPSSNGINRSYTTYLAFIIIMAFCFQSFVSAKGTEDDRIIVQANTGHAAQAAQAEAGPAAQAVQSAQSALAAVIRTPVPRYSREGGWYEEGFSLSLSTQENDASIYYTLDGSEPTEDSILFESPIEIKDRRREKNTISNIQTGTYQNQPRGSVYKGTVVRARAFRQGIEPSDIITHTYFVDEKKSEKYSFPVISLAVNPEDFFGYEQGIYVPGKIYTDKYNKNLEDWQREANYTQKGAEWERRAHMEFFETDGALGFSKDVGIRMHGAATRSYPQKTLRIYSREDYDGKKNIRYEVFSGLTKADGTTPQDRFKRLTLRNSGNDWYYTMFRDALMQELVKGNGVDTQASRPAIVFINGEYWGIHNIRERLDRYYIQNKYEIDDARVVILEGNGQLSEGEPGDEKHYREMIRYLNSHDLSQEEHYQYIQTQMDVDNFIEYQISQIYFANFDWPGNNIQFWRTRTDGYQDGAGYQDGRWRWMLFDTDFGFSLYSGSGGYAHNTLALALQPGGREHPNPDWSTLIFRTLMKNNDFKEKFVLRFADHLNSTFKSSQVYQMINQYRQIYEPEMEEHINRWNSHGTVRDWKSRTDELIIFAQNRPGAVFQHLRDELDLDRTLRLLLDCDDSMGSIQINSILIDQGTPGVEKDPYPWIGVYFKNIPVTLTAQPRKGYHFVSWSGLEDVKIIEEGISENENAQITFTMDQYIKITAVFEPDNPVETTMSYKLLSTYSLFLFAALAAAAVIMMIKMRRKQYGKI